MMKGGLNMTLGGAVASGSGIGIVVSVDRVLIIAKGFKVIIDVGTNLGKDFGTLIQEFSKNNGSDIPVKEKTKINTLHRFFNERNGIWHWSGSTNQVVNFITGDQVPSDIKNYFGMPKKGW